MKDKYYTPSIEEFYVGFEYEIASIDCQWVIHDWNIAEFKAIDSLTAIKDHPYLYRVKYLDKEDVEGFGFKQVDRVNTKRYIKGNCSIWLGDCTKEMLTKIEIVDRLRAVGKTTSFMGGVKNKSELKKLLNQLNIL